MTPKISTPNVCSEYLQTGALQTYCETQGQGRPLLLMHGGLSTIQTSFEKLRPLLAERWMTIAVEQQGHGHTTDIERPLDYEQMVEDTAALLRQIKIANADVFGWSDGGIVALGLAVRHPDLVRKVATIGSGYNIDAWKQDFKLSQATLQPDNDHILPFRNAYRIVAPKPENWSLLVEKIKVM